MKKLIVAGLLCLAAGFGDRLLLAYCPGEGLTKLRITCVPKCWLDEFQKK